MRVPSPEPDGSMPSDPFAKNDLGVLADSGADSSQNGSPELSAAEQSALARRVMRRQGALSLRVAAVFVILLLGLPLFNLYKPEWATASVLGFPATWLFLGVLFYPITVLLSIYFVRHSDRIEAEQASEL